MADSAGVIPLACHECGQPVLFMAEIPELGLRQQICVFKCAACARIIVMKEDLLSKQFDLVEDGCTAATLDGP